MSQALYVAEVPLQDCTCNRIDLTARFTRLTTSASHAVSPPAPRAGHTLTFIPADASSHRTSGSVAVFGGSNRHAQYFTDLMLFDLTRRTWKRAAPPSPPALALSPSSPTAPPARSGHSAVYHANRLIVYGGQVVKLGPRAHLDGDDMAQTFLSDVWLFDCTKHTWTLQITTVLPSSSSASSPPARNGHSAVVWRECMYVLFGSDGDGPSDALWKLNLHTWQWSRVITSGDPIDAREAHALTLPFTSMQSQQHEQVPAGDKQEKSEAEQEGCMDGECWLSGGRSENGVLPTLYSLNLHTARITYRGRAPARFAHSMLPFHSNATHSSYSSTSTSSSPASASSLPSTPASPSALGATAPLPLFFIFGGCDGLTFYNDITCYQPHSHSTPASSSSPASTSSSASSADAMPALCDRCNGPYGWTKLGGGGKSEHNEQQVEQQKQQQRSHEEAKEQLPAMPRSNSSNNKAQRAPVWPSHRMAQCITTVTLSSKGGVSGEPAYFLLGGVNDEHDCDDAFLLQFTPRDDTHSH